MILWQCDNLALHAHALSPTEEQLVCILSVQNTTTCGSTFLTHSSGGWCGNLAPHTHMHFLQRRSSWSAFFRCKIPPLAAAPIWPLSNLKSTSTPALQVRASISVRAKTPLSELCAVEWAIIVGVTSDHNAMHKQLQSQTTYKKKSPTFQLQNCSIWIKVCLDFTIDASQQMVNSFNIVFEKVRYFSSFHTLKLQKLLVTWFIAHIRNWPISRPREGSCVFQCHLCGAATSRPLQNKCTKLTNSLALSNP